MTLDHKLKQFATERQWELLLKSEECGGIRPAARALGINQFNIHQAKKAVLARAAKMGYSPEHDLIRPVPEGFSLRGASTYYPATDRTPAQWVKSAIDREEQQSIIMAAIKGLTEGVKRAKPIKEPKVANSDLLACYPIGDHHVGMLSWKKETGADYDLTISESLLGGAINYLIKKAPNAENALITVLGDFIHTDGMVAKTPTSHNDLDADSRYPKMVEAAIRMLRLCIEGALRKHKKVHVIIEIGNHDLSGSIWLMQLLANTYDREPRITIDTSPKHYHYYQFGKNMIATHHGHGAKPNSLPIIMATDQPKMWGETVYRSIWSGHVHHDSVKDLVGATFESFAILAPEDAYAYQKGYRSKRVMKCIVLHKEFGEVDRYTVNPEMLA